MFRALFLFGGAFLLLLNSLSAQSDPNKGVIRHLTNGPVGGGWGTPTVLIDTTGWDTVRTGEELQIALSDTSRKRIWVADTLRLTQSAPLIIHTPKLVLAGNRGELFGDGSSSPGPTIQFQQLPESKKESLITVKANDVRITGLRLTGIAPREAGTGLRGIELPNQFTNLEVDNCELARWSHAAVWVRGGLNPEGPVNTARIHHNYIHHNNRDGLGYGVLIGPDYQCEAFIESNVFEENRHSVAANGVKGESYFAVNNLTLSNSFGAEYDVHGYSDKWKRNCKMLDQCPPSDPCNYAGTQIDLMGNAVLQSKESTLFVLRGRPTEQARVRGNFFPPGQGAKAIEFRLWMGGSEGGCTNIAFPEKIIPAPKTWSDYNLEVRDNYFNGKELWLSSVSPAGRAAFQTVSFGAIAPKNILYGDMDGDQRTDAVTMLGDQVFVAKGCTGTWEEWSSVPAAMDQMAIEDVDGDGKDDFIVADGRTWRVSWNGKSRLENLRYDTLMIDEVLFGHFDYDGKLDALHANGTYWAVSFECRRDWHPHKLAKDEQSKLLIGDFDGDEFSDILFADGSTWRLSKLGKFQYEVIQKHAAVSSQMLVGHFDEDATSDILVIQDGQHSIYYTGTKTWEQFPASTNSIRGIELIDFDGDGITDLLRREGQYLGDGK